MQNRNGQIEIAHGLAMGEARAPLTRPGPASRARIYSSMIEMLLYEAAISLGISAVAP
jgi:hypothetical protein